MKIEKDIHEKRFEHNLKRYKKYNMSELKELENERKKQVYDMLSFEEIIDAEFMIIQDTIECDQYASDKFKDYVKRIILKIDGNSDKSFLKKSLVVLQLASNIKPVFFEEISNINEENLYIILDSFINHRRKYIRR